MNSLGKGSLASRLKIILELVMIVWIIVGALNALLMAGLLIEPTSPVRRLLNITTLYNVPVGCCDAVGLVQKLNPRDLVETKLLAYVNFRPGTRLGVLGVAMGYFGLWGLYFAILLQLRQVFQSLNSGQPFLRPNVARLRIIGWSIIGAGLFRHAFNWVAVSCMQTVLTVGGGPPTVPLAFILDDLHLEVFFVGAAILVLAEIFREGAELQEEQSLTI